MVHRTLLAALVAATTAATTLVAAPAQATTSTTAAGTSGASSASRPVTNLDHLDFLLDDVPLPEVPGHSTYQQTSDPTATAPWVYADRNADGTYRRVGGGTLDPATGHWGQGAFDADDISRAAVVYVRDWQQNGTASSREHARELLRSLTYLQTDSGPDAGNVVLWQQTDGTLNTSPTPPDSPDPSDSADSFWVGRTVWALGEAYPAFRHADPGFARFLQGRLRLSLDALERQSLASYGRYDTVNGARVPSWLIADSTSATAEAVLGLSAYVRAVPGDRQARTVLERETTGIAAMQRGDTTTWPFGAVLPSATSQSTWNAWGGMAPAALASAGSVLHRGDWQRDARRETAQFAAEVLASGGPDNGWTPTPFDRTQIAYGADSLVQSFLAVGGAGQDRLAAIAAGWYFGANPAGVPVYDRTTGACVDGIAADGTVNRGCGAESSIHTALSMLALDAHPAVRTSAETTTSRTDVDGITTVEAEGGALTGDAAVVRPDAAWTGSANWSGSAYVHAPAGSSVTITIPALRQDTLLYPVVSEASGPAGRTDWTVRGADGRTRSLGSTPNGGAGAQGTAPTPSFLHPLTLARTAPAGTTTITATVRGGTADLDAVLLRPVVSHLGLGSGADSAAGASPSDLFVNGTTSVRSTTATFAQRTTVSVYDRTGRLVRTVHVGSGVQRVPLAPGGSTVAAPR
ncbi:hypothetical protein JOE58_001710 [Curtobacterium luteum]|uniref:Uncharacterized protein n=1 Tax=Curtobacterium luteum TaxID=33881 RepID=A0A8H9GBF8_9MICO|nr:hypothetical protein [Curtobacterium luteum]MBM7802459.1 hypothetical protein [Curtobacterium luteum]NUU50477.1 hypothetical protein [Curtobacterium luteum]GGK92939.1 hypothetical protein GCM10009769_08960 [Curtobacterium luteum]